MLKKFLRPQLAKEIELHRPPSSWPERLFRWGLLFIVVCSVILEIPQLFYTKEQISAPLGRVSEPLGILYVVCFVYMLNYLAYRFVKNRVIRWAWFSLMMFIGLCIVLNYFRR